MDAGEERGVVQASGGDLVAVRARDRSGHAHAGAVGRRWPVLDNSAWGSADAFGERAAAAGTDGALAATQCRYTTDLELSPGPGRYCRSPSTRHVHLIVSSNGCPGATTLAADMLSEFGGSLHGSTHNPSSSRS